VRRPGRAELLLLAASGGVVLGALAAGEAALRWLAPAAAGAGPGDLSRLHVYSERYGWEPRRGYAARVSGRRLSINAAGYRGPLHGPRRPGVERVLVLGDSVAFGLEVGDAETFAALLERPGRREVVNLAVQGYGPDQAALRLEHEGLALRPDRVLLALCAANDFTDVALDRFLYDGRHPKPYFLLRRGALELHDAHLRLGSAGRFGRWLGGHSLLFRRLVELASGDQRPGWHWQRTVDEQEPHWARNVSVVSRLAQRMAEASRQAGADFQVVAFPYRRSWDEGGSRELETLAGMLERSGISLLDLRAAFRERGRRFGEMTVDKLGHLSAAGHLETARILEGTLPSHDEP
jgi:hypothetical protein